MRVGKGCQIHVEFTCKRQPERRQELLLDTDKLLIAYVLCRSRWLYYSAPYSSKTEKKVWICFKVHVCVPFLGALKNCNSPNIVEWNMNFSVYMYLCNYRSSWNSEDSRQQSSAHHHPSTSPSSSSSSSSSCH